MELKIPRYAMHYGSMPRVVITAEIWNEILPGVAKKMDEMEITLDGEFADAEAIHAAAEQFLAQAGIIEVAH